jgi:hypothetical protein
MWCKHCRQDTPIVSNASRHGMCCGRCGAPLTGESEPQVRQRTGEPHPAETGLNLDEPPPGMATNFEDWRLDNNVRAMRARIDPGRRVASPPNPTSTASAGPQWRIDTAHAKAPPRHKPPRRIPSTTRRAPTFTNSALLFGLLACMGGAAVLAWAAAESRGDVWNLGVSAIVAGGIVFLLGLVLQLERIWHNGRFAVHKLREIDAHLVDLERTTASLGVTQGATSHTFYSHLAEGANPYLLLSDLKGQIDLLAMNLARR